MQLSIFDAAKAEQAKQDGINAAVNHADNVMPEWSDLAYDVLLKFIAQHQGSFLAEDVREWGESMLTDPPSKRAWGGVISKARNNGVIRCIGYGTTKNVKAHKTPASLWVQNY